MGKEQRESNFELLRIICMLLIIAGHLTKQSGILEVPGLPINKCVAVVFGSASGIADNVFVMISAWFLTGQKFTAERITKTYLQIATYVIPITIIMLIFFKQYMGLTEIVRGLFPWWGSPLWFGTVYIEMLLFTPFMNVLLMNKKRTIIMLSLLFVINAVPSTFLFRNDFFYSGELVWFCFLYLLIGYIRRFYSKSRINKGACLGGAIIIYSLLLVLYFGVEYLSTNSALFERINSSTKLSTYYFDRYHTIPAFACSYLLFFFFEQVEIGRKVWINNLSKGCFGVYIIHQTPGFAKLMWLEIFKTQEWLYSAYYVFYYIGTVILIFVAGSIVDWLRRKLLDKKINSSCVSKFISEKIRCLYSGF